MTKMWVVFSGLAVVTGVAFVGCQAVRNGYESAPYKVVRKDGKFEVRDYPALTVVETPMADEKSGDGSFSRLFRFISGGNKAKQKIAMTTPVFMSGRSAQRTMAFVMPANMKADGVPKPADGSVTVRELAPGRFAVLRFSGRRGSESEEAALTRLEAWMDQEHLKPLSGPIYGYFDPPWTPPFVRRNEVMVETKADAKNDL